MSRVRAWAMLLAAAFALCVAGCRERKAEPVRYKLELRSNPEGAKVFFMGGEKGVTPFVRNVIPGAYLFKVEKEGHEAVWLMATVKDKAEIYDLRLTRISADVLIDTEPQEARVEMDGKYLGETPLVLRGQPYGLGKVMVSKLNHVSVPLSWEVKDARPVKVSAKLRSNVGMLEIRSTPSEAEVHINGQYFGITPVSKRVEQGRFKVVVSKKGYTVFEDVVTTKRNDKVSLDVKLQRLPGSLRVDTVPAGAVVYINDEEQKRRTPAVFENLQPGDYKVAVSKSGFDSEEKQVAIPQGGQATASFELGSNTGGIDLVVNPPGVTVYLDGKEIGVAEPDADGKFAKVFKIRGIKAGDHEISVAHKRAEPPKKELRVTVEKGKVIRPKPVNMWIANAILKLKSGRKMVGCLRSETAQEVFFEPTPGVRQGFKREEIEFLEMLKEEE